MRFNYAKLTALMAEKKIKQRKLINDIGGELSLSYGRFNAVLRGEGRFNCKQVEVLADYLEIDKADIGYYFF